MRRPLEIRHEFVEYIPKEREEGVLYVSIPYATAVHNCVCGCGIKVVTPISPVGWKLTFDGESVSLDPSIGNWNFPCRSHYFIRRNTVIWAGDMTQDEIDLGRRGDKVARDRHFGKAVSPAQEPPRQEPKPKKKRGIWAWFTGG